MGYRFSRLRALTSLSGYRCTDPGGVLVAMQVVDVDCQDWRAYAACAGQDPDLFFAAGLWGHKRARGFRPLFPARYHCLSSARDGPVDHGIWGGRPERERGRYRRKPGSGDWRALIA